MAQAAGGFQLISRHPTVSDAVPTLYEIHARIMANSRIQGQRVRIHSSKP